jgi:membrane fusion protein
MMVLTGILIALVLVGSAFVATATYARKETVIGWLTPAEGLIRLQARQGGTVSAIHVIEGQFVNVGDQVATLSLSQALEGGDSFAALSRSLNAQQHNAASYTCSHTATLRAKVVTTAATASTWPYRNESGPGAM